MAATTFDSSAIGIFSIYLTMRYTFEEPEMYLFLYTSFNEITRYKMYIFWLCVIFVIRMNVAPSIMNKCYKM